MGNISAGVSVLGGHGLGSFDQITRGQRVYWRFRITINGKTHERVAKSKAALWTVAHALRASAQMGGDDADAAADAIGALGPIPTQTTPEGRKYVRLASPEFRQWIYKRDHGRCGICGLPVAFADMHVDHIRPRTEGGNDDITNLRVSHPACNIRRGSHRQWPIFVT